AGTIDVLRILDNNLLGSSSNAITILSKVNKLWIIGNEIESGAQGIYFNYTSETAPIAGGAIIKDNTITPPLSERGIYLVGDILRPIIKGNVVTQGAEGVRISSGVDYAIIKDNDFFKCAVGV